MSPKHTVNATHEAAADSLISTPRSLGSSSLTRARRPSAAMESELDELSSNPFFIALQSQTALMAEVARDGSLVCVPAAESLKLCKLTGDFLATHILTASSHFADTYTTRNGKTCTLKDGRIVCRAGFPRPRTVMVVYEETFYDDEFNSVR